MVPASDRNRPAGLADSVEMGAFMKRFVWLVVVPLLVIGGLFSLGIYAYKNRLHAPVSAMLSEETKQTLRDTVLIFQTKEKLEREVAGLERRLDQMAEVQDLLDVALRTTPNLPDHLPFTLVGEQQLETARDRFSVLSYETPFVPMSHWGRRAYVDIHADTLWLITAKGTAGRVALDEIAGKTFDMVSVDTNIPDLITDGAFYDYGELSIKDVLVTGDDLLISYTKKTSGDCYALAIAAADLTSEPLVFEDIFIPDECVAEDNSYGEFSANQTGGRMLAGPPGTLLVSTGEWRVRDLSQDPDSFYGKVAGIDLARGEVTVKSMGHRNPQGFYFDPEANVIVVAEHGPFGGDEININRSPDGAPENYGWPIVSYGEHYSTKQEFYDKAPLHKSHAEHGFEEPDLHFELSLSPSQLVRLPDDPRDPDRYALMMGTMGFDYREGDESLHILDLDDDFRIISRDRIILDQRVRDIVGLPGTRQFVLFLEGSDTELARIALVTVNP